MGSGSSQLPLPVKALGAHCRTLFQNRLRKEHPALFAQVPARVWQRHWNVDCRPAGSGENALRYLARYVFKTATSNRQVQLLPNGKVRWPYRDSKTGKPALDSVGTTWTSWRGFCSTSCPAPTLVCAPLAGCIRRPKSAPNRVRALLHEKTRAYGSEQQSLEPAEPAHAHPLRPSQPRSVRRHFAHDARKSMRLVASWRGSQVLRYPQPTAMKSCPLPCYNCAKGESARQPVRFASRWKLPPYHTQPKGLSPYSPACHCTRFRPARSQPNPSSTANNPGPTKTFRQMLSRRKTR